MQEILLALYRASESLTAAQLAFLTAHPVLSIKRNLGNATHAGTVRARHCAHGIAFGTLSETRYTLTALGRRAAEKLELGARATEVCWLEFYWKGVPDGNSE